MALCSSSVNLDGGKKVDSYMIGYMSSPYHHSCVEVPKNNLVYDRAYFVRGGYLNSFGWSIGQNLYFT